MAYGKILTGLLDHFLDGFLGHFCFVFFCFFCSLSVLRRGERQTFVTVGGVEDEQLVRRKGWGVVLVNATD